ncbi:MAG TPA: DMT family transporter [Xanthobacteraceae bacterium]|nr:DMT family transporter [Xanthobacteraceae bacterium]
MSVEQKSVGEENDRAGVIPGNPYLLLALASLFWSGNHIVGRAIAGVVPPFGVSALRWLLPAIVLWPFARPHLLRDWPRLAAHRGLLLFLGITGGAIFTVGQYVGLQYTTALNVSVLNSFAPVVILACGALIFRDHLRLQQILGIAVSFCGVIVIVTKMEPQTLFNLTFNKGDIIIVANMALVGVYTSYMRKLPPLHWLSFIFVFALISAVFTLPFAVWEDLSGYHFQFNALTVFSVVYVAIFPSVISYAAYTRGIELIGPNRAGPFLHLIPLYSAVFASLFLGERLMAYHAVGFALILTGVWLAVRK